MKLGCAVLVALVVLTGLLLAQLPDDQPVPVDSVRSDSLSLWPDTIMVSSDSTSHPTFRHGWLYPMGVMMATCVGIMLLFSTRSH